MRSTRTPLPHRALSVHSWADLIRSRIHDPHVAAWAASVIYWDFGTEEAAVVMEPIMAHYDKFKTATDRTETIVDALRTIGFGDPEGRCVLKQDSAHANRTEWGDARPRGV